MNQFAEKALLHLTGRSNINLVSVEELESICNEHPYFSVARVLLSRKLKLEQSDNFLPHVQKTALYFTNPHWLHYQLMNEEPEISLQNYDPDDNATPVSEQKEESRKIYEQLRSVSKKEVPAVNQANIDTAEISPVQTLLKQEAEHTNGRPAEPGVFKNVVPIDDEYPNSSINNATIIAADDQNSVVETEPAEKVPGDPATSEEDGTLLTGDETEEAVMPDELHPEMEEVLEEIDQQEADKEIIKEQANSGNTHESIDNSEASIEQPVAAEEQNSPPVSAPENALQSIEQKTEPLIPVEPYYTVDYFASQGIKLLLEKYPKDRLGQQLRSFTDWLKYMKKIGPENSVPTSEEAQMESTIQKIADTSNIPREIITETMAEVLEKQGKKDQAIQLYMKLSFLDPAKSAYFAGKIENLKGT